MNEQMTQEEAIQRVKCANADGFMTHLVVAGGKTADEARDLYEKSDAKADKLLQKRATIRTSIAAELQEKGKLLLEEPVAVPA